MPSQVQFRGGDKNQNDNFIGADREITINTDNNTIRVHDGTSQGGTELARADLTNVVGAINVGYALTSGISTVSLGLTGTPNIVGGIVTATKFVGDGSGLTGFINANYATSSGFSSYSPISGVATYSPIAGIATLAQNLAGIPNIQVGLVTATTFYGDGSGLFNIPTAGDSYWIKNITGIHTASNIGIGTSISTSKLHVVGDGLFVGTGIVTANRFSGDGSTLTNINASSIVGVVSYSSIAGISTYSSISGVSTYSSISGLSTYSPIAGISTYSFISGVSTYSTIAGIATLAQNLSGTPNIVVGIVTAIKYIGDGSSLSNLPIESYWVSNGSGISTVSNVGIGTSISTSKLHVVGDGLFVGTGIVTANRFSGDGSTLTNINASSIVGVVSYSSIAGISTYSTISGVATYSSISGVSTYSSISGVSTYSTIAGISTYSSIAGIATLAQNLAGTPNISVGIVTAIKYIGDGSSLSNLPIESYWVSNGSGISTVSNVGIGTSISTSKLHVVGNALISGIVTANRFSGDGSTLTNINASSIVGVVSYSSIAGISTYSSISGVSTYSTIAGIATLAQNLSGTPNITVGIVTAIKYIGDGSSLSNLPTGSYWVSNGSGISTGSNVGIGISLPTSKLHVVGNVLVSGVVTATNFVGNLTGTATTAVKLENVRTFQITGPITASAQNFDGTQNVSLASTIQSNSIGLGTHTYGDYVKNILGTVGEIEVSISSGEGVSTQIGLPSDVAISNNLTVNNDVQINRNLNVNGNITIGGTTAFLNISNLLVKDKDIVSGYTVDILGNDVSTDTTANTGGIAVASTEGSPIVNLNIVGIETLPPTYKKIMWFKSGSFAGLNTDAWMFNYGVGIGSTQIPFGTRLAVGAIQFTDQDLIKVRNINASGIITGSSFVPSSGYIKAPDGTNSFYIYSGTGNVSFQGTIGASQINNSSGNKIIGFSGTTITFENDALVKNNLLVSGVSTVNSLNSGNINSSGIVTANSFVGNLTGTATTATYSSSSGISTVSQGLTGTPNIVVGIVTANSFVGNLTGTATTATNVIGGIGSLSLLNVSNVLTVNSLNAGNINSSGITTAVEFITGPNGIGINTNTIYGPSVMIIDPDYAGGNSGILRIKGDLYVDGTQTIINSSSLGVAGYQVAIGTTAVNDIILDGAGIGIGSIGARKTFTWEYSTASLKSSESINLNSGKTYEINGIDVLSSSSLGTGILNSSLTSLGTLTALNVSGISTLPYINTININASGIITALSFVGNGSGLTNLPVTGVATATAPLSYNAGTQTISIGAASTITAGSMSASDKIKLDAVTGSLVGTTDTQTLTNKTLGTVRESVFAITDGASVDLNPSNGAIQTWVLGASRTATANNFPAGASMLLCVDDGSAFTLTWPTITWVGSTVAPTLATTGYTFIQMWKIGTTLYGMATK